MAEKRSQDRITETWEIGRKVSLLVVGLILGREDTLCFTKLGRPYRIRATLHPYQVVIEPFDH